MKSLLCAIIGHKFDIPRLRTTDKSVYIKCKRCKKTFVFRRKHSMKCDPYQLDLPLTF